MRERRGQLEQQDSNASQSHEEPSGPPDFLKEYEIAKQECAEADGKWVTSLHWDGAERYGFILRCLKESRPPPHDPRWDDRLLPYDISVTYSRETYKEIGFKRVAIEQEADERNLRSGVLVIP